LIDKRIEFAVRVWTAGNLAKSENSGRADYRTLRHKTDSQD